MKKFYYKILTFTLPALMLLLSGLFIPTTPRAVKSDLMSSIHKNSLLQNTPGPRILFVGGSNLSFGLNSQIIKDSLRLAPINTAINVLIGVRFMIDNTLEYIQDGDIVILIPEYSQYYRSLNHGTEELMRMVLDVKLNNVKHLNIYQILNILPYLPKYSLTKYNVMEYCNIKESEIYSVHSFNQFGDTYTHWDMQQQEFAPYDTVDEKYNYKIIKYFEEFSISVNNKNGIVLVAFPGLHETTYNNIKNQILKVEQELLNSNLAIIGSAERYKMPDSLMFNTPYHLNKQGVDYRTKMIIEDIKKARIHIGVDSF